MEAESLHTHRPALFGSVRARLNARGARVRPRRRALAVLIAVATFTPAMIGASATTAAPAQAITTPTATAAEPTSVTITLAPAQGAIVRPGEDLPLIVSVDNGTDQTLSGPIVTIGLSDDTLSDSAELASWLRPSDDVIAESDAESFGMPGDAHVVATVELPSVAGGTSSVTPVTVPAASLGLDTAEWGAQGLVASLISNGAVVSASRSTTVLVTGETPRSPLGIVMPITTPASDLGLIPSETLALYTGPGGMLTRSLDAALSHTVAIALDPKILVSIRVLGSSTPSSALDWLERLSGATNEIFALPYSDADITAQAQLGVSPFLAPLSFDDAIDPANFTATAPTSTPTPREGEDAPGAQPSTEPSGEPTAETVPTLDELLAWPYSLSGMAWPAPGLVSAAVLPTFTANGFGTTIISGSNIALPDSAQPPASARAGEMALLVADTELNSAVNDAITATQEIDWQAAIARVGAAAAVAADESTPRALLAALPREWPSNPSYVNAKLSALEQLPFVSSVGLTALNNASAPELAVGEAGESPERLAAVANLIERETALTGFSTAVADPTTITGPERASLLALLDIAWIPEDAAWRTAVGDDLARTREILDSVSVVQSTSVLVVGGSAQFPVTVQNSYTQPVTLTVSLLPSNGRLVVDESVDVTIDAASSSTVLVPVNAHVGNGAVDVQITLTTSAGVQLGSPVTIPVNVQADWEGLGAALMGAAILLFFGFGIFRNIRRRRRERAAGDGGLDTENGSTTPAEVVTGIEGSADADESESPRG
ncbi:MAG: DUF6049 family protein [Microterricola sp.]